jgi:aldose 1-epimerase
VRALVLAILVMTSTAHADVTHRPFGKTADGRAVDAYVLRSPSIEVEVISYGARITRILAPDHAGKRGDVALGYARLADYEHDKSTYLGAVVGRYGNRIAGGRFTLDGKRYQVPLNNGPNALHGGTVGFDQKVWSASEVPGGVELKLVSDDGDMGFPGRLTATVRYTVEGATLHVAYTATSDRDTVVNLTQHAYFNLGNRPGTVLEHQLTIPAARYTPVDATLIPTGELAPVAGTPFDFRTPTAIGARIGVKDEQLTRGRGYDHNWVLDGSGLKTAAEVHEPHSGRVMTVRTTEPGVQFYSGNFLDGTLVGRSGVTYVQRSGLCLETQHFPDSPNHPTFPSTVLRAGQTLHSETTFTFSTRSEVHE